MACTYEQMAKMENAYSPQISCTNIANNNNSDDEFEHDNYNYNDQVMSKMSHEDIYNYHLAYRTTMELEEKYYEVLRKSEDDLNNSFQNIQHFFAIEDRRIMEWHFASWEHLLGAPLNETSFKTFANGDDYSCKSGPQLFTHDGYASILSNLVDSQLIPSMGSLKIELEKPVKEIMLLPDKAQITTGLDNTNLETRIYDVVVCTLPLGVLKKTIDSKMCENNKVTFSPPLPSIKVDAITKLGIGIVEKIIFTFDRKFWGSDDMFGNIPLSKQSRGEFFLFFSHCSSSKPVLVSILCGQTALIKQQQKVPADLIASRCLSALKEMFDRYFCIQVWFGFTTNFDLFISVPIPTYYCVSDWSQNENFLGSHSVISVSTGPEVHDAMALPLAYGPNCDPRLFFAGEHTSSVFCSSVHGAYSSGLKEAAKIANIFGTSCRL